MTPGSVLLVIQQHVCHLVTSHFCKNPIELALSGLYCDLREEVSLRSSELVTLSLDSLSVNGQLVLEPNGFAVFKSDAAKRYVDVPPSLAAKYRETAGMVARARPEQTSLFLHDGENRFQFLDKLQSAYSAAIRQTTKDPRSRAHLSRAMAPLDQLLPGWEDFLRSFLNGSATTATCLEFVERVRSLGFTAILDQIHKTGHGHPNTYLSNYFPVWDLLLSVYAQASLANIEVSARDAVKRMEPTISSSFRQAAHRKKGADDSFDGWMWLSLYRSRMVKATALDLPKSAIEPASKTKFWSEIQESPGTLRLRQAHYLALRHALLDTTSAMDASGLNSNDAKLIEPMVSKHASSVLTARQQFEQSPRGTRAVQRYLRGETGTRLLSSVLHTSQLTVERFLAALIREKCSTSLPQSQDAIKSDLLNFASCLPKGFGVWVVFGSNPEGPDITASLHQVSPGLYFGPSDRGLGMRHSISIVSADDARNLVLRARLTAATKCALAAAHLLNKYVQTAK